MKIGFEIDREKKSITLIFREEDFRKIAERVTNGEFTSRQVSQRIAVATGLAVDRISSITGIKPDEYLEINCVMEK